MIALRPYQLDAVEQVRAQVRAGVRRVLMVLPTGGGKTSCAAHMMARTVASGGHALFVAHRRELINQCYGRLVEAGIEEAQIGVVMAADPRRRAGAPVQVASLDSLRHRARPRADLVIVDEAHRALAKSYRDLAAAYPKAIHIGLTATPYCAGGRGLGDAYDALVVVATPKQLIAAGYLVEPLVFTVPETDRPDLSGVRVRGGDYDENALAEAVNRRVLVGNIVEHWTRRAGGVRTVVFAVSIEHSRHLTERFVDAGVPAEHLDGATPAAERDAILARLERGVTRVVSNVGVLCEGWDQPSVKCCVLARPTKSTGLYLQQAGRVLRPWTHPVTGLAPRALLLDHAGCALEHGLPQDDREFSLEEEPRKKRGAASAPPRALACGQCSAVLAPNVATCPECGLRLREDEPPAVPVEVDAELIELPEAALERWRAEWDELCATANERGYREGWAYHRFRERFGVPPPKSFRFRRRERAASDFTAEEKRAYFRKLEEVARERGYARGYVFVRYRAKFGEAPELETSPAMPSEALADSESAACGS